MTPRLSILLPTFNGSRYLSDQIQSILAQTMGDFELLAVDDGSTDGTRDRLDAFMRQDRRVHVLPSDGNRGQTHRLAQLAATARAEVISVADQDDIWAPDKLDRLFAALGDTALAFGSSWIIDGEGREAGTTILDLLPPKPEPGDRLTYLFKPMVSAHAMIARRPIFSDLSLRRAHPFDWLQALDAVFTDGIAWAPDAVTYHRLHGANQSNGAVGRPGLWRRMAPAAQKQRQNLRYTERWTLTQRLEHLSHSPLVGGSLNATFRRAYRLCAAAWFDMDRPMSLSDPALAVSLADVLAPLAGSPGDLHFARRQITRLSRSAWQPLDAAWQLAATVRGPRVSRIRSAG